MSDSDLTNGYLDIARLIERLHRRFLDVMRAEINRLGVSNLNAVQALLLVNIGDEEIVIRDLIERGYYLGSNVSYNIKKMVEGGWLEQRRSEHDRRSVRIKLTAKALDLCQKFNDLEARQSVAFAQRLESAEDMEEFLGTLRKLERTWADYIQYG